jgi:hypothetical protein
MYAVTNKGMRDGLQPSSKESGEEDASQAEQSKRREEKGNSAGRNRIGHFQITRPVAMNNSFTPLRDLPMENAEGVADETPLKHLEQMRFRER